MSAILPSDIAMLGDDFREHLRHFSPAERLAVAFYLLTRAAADILPADRATALELAANTIAAGLISP